MEAPVDSLTMAEQSIHAIEQSAARSFDSLERPYLPTIVWHITGNRGARLLFASLAADPLTFLADTGDVIETLPIPVTIVRGQSLALACRLGPSTKTKPPAALESMGIDTAVLKKAAADGMLTLSADESAPVKLSDPDQALALVVRMLADTSGDRLAVESITLTLPQNRLADVTIQAHHTTPAEPVEAVWAMLPFGGLNKTETAALATMLSQSPDALLVPFVRIDAGDLETTAKNGDALPSLQALITAQSPDAGLHDGPMCPLLPLGDTLFGPSPRKDGSYLRQLFDSSWDATIAYSRPLAVANRQERLALLLLDPPGTILGLMRAHALLPELRDLVPPSAVTPSEKAFRTLAATGAASYQGRLNELIKELAKATAKKAAPPPKAGTKPASVPPKAAIAPEPAVEPEPAIPVEDIAPESVTVEPAPEPVPEPEPEPKPIPIPEPKPEPEPVPEPDEKLLTLARFLTETAAIELFCSHHDKLLHYALEIEEQARTGAGEPPKAILGLLSGLATEAGQGLSDIEAHLANTEKKLAELSRPKRKPVSPEALEPLEQAEMFWRDFVPASLKKVAIRKYDDDVRGIVLDARKVFDNYLDLTPDIEEGFQECKKKEWPRLSKETTQKMNALFDDILDLWKLSVGQQFSTLEDFRSERFPQEPAFDTGIPLKTGKRPTLKGTLTSPIPKKPGIITKILTMKAESSVWRDNLIKTFQEEANGSFDQYRKDAIGWLKNAYTGVGSLLNSRVETAKKQADFIQRRIQSLSEPEKPDTKSINVLKQTIQTDQDTLKQGQNALETFENAWKKHRDDLGL